MGYDVKHSIGARSSITITRTDTDPPTVVGWLDTLPDIRDPFWTTHPDRIGQQLRVYGDIDGVPWTACLVSGPFGWDHVAGLAVGLYGVHDEVTAAYLRAGLPTVDDSPNVQGLYLRAGNAAEAFLRDLEGTRRVVVAIIDGLIPERVKRTNLDRSPAQQVDVAARIYNLVCGEMTRPKPIPFIAAFLDCSERKAGDLVARARATGQIKAPARVGYPNARPTRSTSRKASR